MPKEFKNSDPFFWRKIIKYKEDSDSKVMWEIGCDATYPENYENIKKIAKHIDIFSINLTESKHMMGTEDIEEIIKEYQSFQIPLVFLRRGADGAIMITPDEAIIVPSQKNIKVVDPTGGGNSSSGAVLYGFCEGYSPLICGKMGSISAAMCISQYGVPDRITSEMRLEAMRNVER